MSAKPLRPQPRTTIYTRIPIIPGLVYLVFSRSGISLSFGNSRYGRANASSRGVRVSKTLPGGIRISKNFGGKGKWLP